MRQTFKRGPLSIPDMAYIRKNRGRKPPEVMSGEIRRDPEQIARFLAELDGEAGPEAAVAAASGALRSDLDERPDYREIRKTLSRDQDAHLRSQYVALCHQFGEEDLTETDRGQVFQYILAGIKLVEVDGERKIIADAQKDLAGRIDELREDAKGNKGVLAEVRDLRREHADNVKLLGEVEKRAESIGKQQQALLKALRGTRADRVKTHIDTRDSFLGVLKAIQDPRFREEAGRDAAEVRVAAMVLQIALRREITYADGTRDSPLLLPDPPAVPRPARHPREGGPGLDVPGDELVPGDGGPDPQDG